MKFKVVNTYTGYSEMSIESLKEREASSLRDIHNEVNNEVKALEWYDPEFFGSDFSDMMEVANISWIGYGEENVFLIIPETHEMYKEVARPEDMSEKMWDKWVKFCRDLHF
jgi:hypothetical protein